MQKRHSVWPEKGFTNKEVGVNLETQVKARVGESLCQPLWNPDPTPEIALSVVTPQQRRHMKLTVGEVII